MNETQNEALGVQLARVASQLSALASNVDDIKQAVQAIPALDRSIAEMTIHSSNARRDIDLLWARVEAERSGRDELEAAVDAVDDKVDEMKHTARGAIWVLGIVFGVVQVCFAGSIAWVFTHINEGDALNRLQQQRLEILEQAVNRGLKG
ncbi:hypothetical protein [Paraburkholderia sp. SIMBA_030]|uniref:hypothetical protein n=1 Tax=Paraburkholderia sp. SIMBA_030 TaxID=3085773 RepID=UPI003979F0D0